MAMSCRPPLRLVGVLALGFALITGCSSAGPDAAAPPSAAATESAGDTTADTGTAGTATSRVFSADNGEITIPADPQRVVATGYAVPVLIEADANLVGISTWPRGTALMTPEDLATYEGMEKIGGALAAETNYEAIASVKPDLIVIGVPRPVLADIDVTRLEAVAPVVAIGPTVPDAWRELSRRQADAAGRLENFDAAQAAYQAKAAELKTKYSTALAGLEFGHLGAYGEVAQGNFHREFAGSWGTNIAQDIGVTYPGEPAEKTGGGGDVSEYPSIEQLPQSLGTVDAITYTVQPDGTPAAAVQYVLDSDLWKNLPAVQAGNAFPVKYTEAATFTSAMLTLDALDQTLTPLLSQ
ncbi:MAG: ABC transporter substrate-binding protein [Nakamurella sp.]